MLWNTPYILLAGLPVAYPAVYRTRPKLRNIIRDQNSDAIVNVQCGKQHIPLTQAAPKAAAAVGYCNPEKSNL